MEDIPFILFKFCYPLLLKIFDDFDPKFCIIGRFNNQCKRKKIKYIYIYIYI
jgi:hypothetical protein